jgi:hypothetical protein
MAIHQTSVSVEVIEGMGNPRNWDACWKVDRDDGENVYGSRETLPPFDRMPWFPLIPNTIKVFPSMLVLIEIGGNSCFSGKVFLGAAIFSEWEL